MHQVSVISTEKTAIIKERDEAKAQAAKLQEAMQRASLAAASMANGHAVAEVGGGTQNSHVWGVAEWAGG